MTSKSLNVMININIVRRETLQSIVVESLLGRDGRREKNES